MSTWPSSAAASPFDRGLAVEKKADLTVAVLEKEHYGDGYPIPPPISRTLRTRCRALVKNFGRTRPGRMGRRRGHRGRSDRAEEGINCQFKRPGRLRRSGSRRGEKCQNTKPGRGGDGLPRPVRGAADSRAEPLFPGQTDFIPCNISPHWRPRSTATAAMSTGQSLEVSGSPRSRWPASRAVRLPGDRYPRAADGGGRHREFDRLRQAPIPIAAMPSACAAGRAGLYQDRRAVLRRGADFEALLGHRRPRYYLRFADYEAAVCHFRRRGS